MLKRFMSWLLNRLQKLFSPLDRGRRPPTSVPSQSAAYPTPPADAVEPESISPTSAQPTAESVANSADAKPSRQDAPKVYEPVTVSLETSTSASDLIASGALNYLLEAPDSEELPEIHDLLPAVEPEMPVAVEPETSAPTLPKPTAAVAEKSEIPDEILPDETPAHENSLSEPSSEPPDLSVDRFNRVSESLPEETVTESVVEPPPQAVLLSFDIVESEPTEETPSDIPPEVVKDFEETSSAPLTTAPADETPDAEDSNNIEAIDSTEALNSELPLEVTSTEESLFAREAPAEGSPEDRVDSPETSQKTVSETALPEADSAVETTSVSTAQPPEADASAKKTDPIKADSFTEEPTKQGVVKLLFTLKQGNYHGYIAPDDGTKDILFHQKYINADIFDRLERGANVVVTVKYIEGKAYATRVDLL